MLDFGLSGASVSSSDEEWSFGLAMLVNDSADEAVVERIEIERNEGIDVIGLGLGPHMTEEIWAQVVVPGTVHGWPPEDVEVSSVEGSVVPPAGTDAAGEPDPGLRFVLAGVRLRAGHEHGELHGITVIYRHRGTVYRQRLAEDILELRMKGLDDSQL